MNTLFFRNPGPVRQVCGAAPLDDLHLHLERRGIKGLPGVIALRSDLLTRQPLELLPRSDADGVAALATTGKPWASLCVLTDPKGFIIGFERNPCPELAETNLCVAGACWFADKPKHHDSLEETIIRSHESGARLRALLLPGKAFIVGSAGEQLRACHNMLSGRVVPPVAGCEPCNGTFIQGEVHRSARVEGTLWTAPGSRVEEDCVLENCVVLENAVAGRGSRLRNALVEAGARVRPGTIMEEKYPSFLGEPE